MSRVDPRCRVTLLIQGRVQGVAFREAARRQAQEFGMSGIAENLTDGSVRIVAEGTRAAAAEFIRWCRKGPPLASVSDVRVEWGEAGSFLGEDFRIR